MVGHWLHFPDQCTVLNDISYSLQSVTVFDIADRAGLSKDLVLMDDLCIFVDYLVLDDDILADLCICQDLPITTPRPITESSTVPWTSQPLEIREFLTSASS